MLSKCILVLSIQAIVLGCFSGCNPKSQVPTYYMDQEFKDYALFPMGSYWIYEEVNSKAKDSLSLYFQEIELNGRQKIYPFNFETFIQNLSSTFFKDTLFGGGSANERYKHVYFSYSERYLSNYLVTNLQFYNQQELNTIIQYSEDSKVEYESFHEKMDIDGVSYSEVRVFECLIPTNDRLPQRVYYARHVGVIRKELFNGQVWNLKRHHINN